MHLNESEANGDLFDRVVCLLLHCLSKLGGCTTLNGSALLSRIRTPVFKFNPRSRSKVSRMGIGGETDIHLLLFVKMYCRWIPVLSYKDSVLGYQDPGKPAVYINNTLMIAQICL